MAAMDIDTDEDILRKVAADGSMDFSSWPALLPTVVSRIEKAARNDFSIPVIPPPQLLGRPSSPRLLAPLPSSDPVEPPETEGNSSQDTNKENANPSVSSSVQRQASSVTAATASGSSASNVATLQPADPCAFPAPIAALLDEITSTITANFHTYPPHTIQRLAELVLHPKQHYQHLAAYLHALDRVVHVTSGANIYPLPPAIPEPAAMSRLANGHGGGGTSSGLSINSAAANNIGSDEALGGALLTPIAWLTRRANGEDGSSDVGSSSPVSPVPSPVQGQHATQPQGGHASPHRQGGSSDRQMETESTETIEGPNGMGRIETVSVSITNGVPSLTSVSRGVTQGELLRQEQRAGVIPMSQLTRHGHSGGVGTASNTGTGSGASGGAGQIGVSAPGEETGDAIMDDSPEDEVPHARGPEEIGAADTGPQNPNSTFHANPGTSIDMQDIDVEAAVGRRGEGTRKSPEPAETGGTTANPGPAIPKSPKREANDEPGTNAAKRLKEAEQCLGDEQVEKQQLEKDTEGDPSISESTPEPKATVSDAGEKAHSSKEMMSTGDLGTEGGGETSKDQGPSA